MDKEYYAKQRMEVMTEEEIRESNKVLDWYKKSWRDKDMRGLFDKWQEAELYWEGDVNLPESDADPGSNTNIVNSNVEGQVALLVEQNIGIEVIPKGPSDAPFADVVQTILEWIKDNNKLKRKLDVHERRREKFGTGILRVLFDPDFMNGFGLPVIDVCNPAYVFVDPAITDVFKIQEARFIIEIMNKSIHWAENNSKFDNDRVKAIMPGFDPIEGDWIFGEDDGENEVEADSYVHMLVWTKEKGKLRLREMSGCGVVLYDSFKDKKNEEETESFFPDNRYPYFFTPLYYREGTVWGKSDVELLIPVQDLINDIDDQIRMNGRLTGNPQKLIDTSSGIDVDKWTNEAGLNIPTNDINGATYLTPPNMPKYIIDRRNQALSFERQIVTRFSDQMTGNNVQGVDTATEALALQQAGTSGINHKKLLLQETLSEVFQYCLSLVKEYYTEEQAFRITEKSNEFIWFRGSQLKEVPYLIPASQSYIESFRKENQAQEPPKWMQLKDETKEAMFDIKITVGAGLPSNKAFVYTVIKEAFATGAITPQEYRRLLREYVNLPVEETPEMQQQQPTQQQIPIQNQNISPNIMGMGQRGPAVLGMLGGGQGVAG